MIPMSKINSLCVCFCVLAELSFCHAQVVFYLFIVIFISRNIPIYKDYKKQIKHHLCVTEGKFC